MDRMMETPGDRMKRRETDSGRSGCVDMRAPVIIRLDGCRFHTWVKKARLRRPFDRRMIDAMQTAALALCNETQSSVMAYVQSDEISLVLRNDQSERSEAWFGDRMQKLCSISASICSVALNGRVAELTDGEAPPAYFDSRVMCMPNKEEVFSCILWRQRDCVRNSISGLAQASFSQKELDGMSSDDRLRMLAGKGVDWELLPMDERYGAMMHRGEMRLHYYDGVESVRKVLFVDTLFGKVDSGSLERAYDLKVKEGFRVAGEGL